LEILAVVPARGGSKGFPGKNVAMLHGKPLLAWTCKAAAESKQITRTVLSTDDEHIAAAGRTCGVEVPFLRPAELSADDTPSVDVVLHALRFLADTASYQPDAVILLQPTSPLRTGHHIDEALTVFTTGRAQTVVSVVEVPHRYSPYSVMRLENGTLKHFWQEPLPFDRYHRQSQPKFYARNGPAILITRTDVLVEQKSFYGDPTLPYIMSAQDSIDIDNGDDLQLAEMILSKKGE
jgi:CMP-N,N'-diacetyllegionaminic acid synthase